MWIIILAAATLFSAGAYNHSHRENLLLQYNNNKLHHQVYKLKHAGHKKRSIKKIDGVEISNLGNNVA